MVIRLCHIVLANSFEGGGVDKIIDNLRYYFFDQHIRKKLTGKLYQRVYNIVKI